MVIPLVYLTFHPEYTEADCCWDQQIVRWLTEGFWRRRSFDGIDGAVVVIPARHNVHAVDQINDALAKLRWALVVLTSDEESEFPADQITHNRFRLWVQAPTVPPWARSVPLGWTPHTTFPAGIPEKTEDWFFAGQITHERRHRCVEALSTIPGGTLITTEGFTQGLNPAAYMAQMARAKIIPCPSGPVWVDTFRVWEALEAGCIPIVDTKTPGNDQLFYWRRLFPDGSLFPFPLIDEWWDLPRMMRELLDDWPNSANQVQAWWIDYKQDLRRRFAADLEALQ